MKSFSFTLSGKHFIFPSILRDSFAGQRNLGCMSLLFITQNTSCQSHLAYKLSLDKSPDIFMGTALHITLCFSLAVFKILFLFLTFGILIMMCLGVVLCGSTCLVLSMLPGLVCLFPSPNQGSFIIFSTKFSISCSPLLLLAPLYLDADTVGNVPESSYTILVF